MSFQTQYQPELESIQDIPSFHNPFTENPLCLNILRDSEEESVFAKSAEFFKNYKLACDKNSMMQEDYKEPIPYEPRDIPFTTNLLFEGSSNTEDDLVSLCSQSCYQINLNTIEKDFTVCKVVNQIDESEGKFDDSTSPDIEEIKENIPSKKEKSYMKSKPFDIYEHISERLRTFTSSLNNSNHKKTRGRPRKTITDEEKQFAIDEWSEKLISKVNDFDSRSDAYFIAIARKFKKIPELLLNLIGYKGDYKSDDLKITLDSYLDCFKGFMQYFKISIPEYLKAGSEEEYELINLFLDFITIKFPKDRVSKLLEMFNRSESPKIFSFSLRANTINLREATSIESFAEFFNANSAYKLICIEYHKLIPNIEDDIDEKLQEFVYKLLVNCGK
jgi:hypothetical protein